jgi:phosphatidylserine/phosphatidylglycerophosphate/cardiolipin synthase-like enzyme
MKPFRLYGCCFVVGLATTVSGCLLHKSSAEVTVSAAGYKCSNGVRLIDFLGRYRSCYKRDLTEPDDVLAVGKQRLLPNWIPCNGVELVSEASNKQFDIDGAIGWLRTAPVIDQKMVETVFANPEHQPKEFANSPILRSPSHHAIVSLIRNAKHTLFMDVMLFGGGWATEILREALLANKQRGVQVVVVRDSKNLFWFKPEIEPFWSGLVKHAAVAPGVSAVRSDTLHRGDDVPFLLSAVNQISGSLTAFGGDLQGTSDHSKIIIADGFQQNAAAFVTSKNWTDFNFINFDEGVIVRGPAAGALQVSYVKDFEAAIVQAKNERSQTQEPLLNADDFKILADWQEGVTKVSAGGENAFRYPAQGNAAVRHMENNSNNSATTIEHTLLNLIVGAKKSIRVYNFLGHNPLLAKALVDAEKRLGEGSVRVLFDGADSYLLNQIGTRSLIMQRDASIKTPITTMARWRKVHEIIPAAAVTKGIRIEQEQHTKTIVVDDRFYVAGSGNFDLGTLGGAFRETSLLIDDAKTAANSGAIFDSIWNDPSQVTTTETLALLRPLETLEKRVQEFAVTALADEQRRVRALNPRNIEVSDKCQ